MMDTSDIVVVTPLTPCSRGQRSVSVPNPWLRSTWETQEVKGIYASVFYSNKGRVDLTDGVSLSVTAVFLLPFKKLQKCCWVESRNLRREQEITLKVVNIPLFFCSFTRFLLQFLAYSFFLPSTQHSSAMVHSVNKRTNRLNPKRGYPNL